jgi:hypothetical protein
MYVSCGEDVSGAEFDQKLLACAFPADASFDNAVETL